MQKQNKKGKKVNTCGELFTVPRVCCRFVEVSFLLGRGKFKVKK